MKTFFEQTDQWFQTLVESSLTGISLIEGNRFVYMNSEQLRMFNSNKNLTHFKDLIVHKNDHQKFKQICKAIEDNKPLRTDIEIRFFPDQDYQQRQEYRHVVVRTDIIDYQSKTLTLLNMVDVTHSKRMERLALIRSKMESLGHVSVGIAHEIRSPLAGIEFLLEGIRDLINSDSAKDEILELLDQTDKAAEKIETVIKRVLDFSKPSEPQVKPSNINDPIQSAVKLSEAALRKTNIKLITNLIEPISMLYIDNHQIEQVFLNLISNAIEALNETEGEKVIEINSEQRGNDVYLEIADSGKGIPEHLRHKIFDPFFSTGKSGTGIGLSICQRIIADHGGTMSINTSKYNGAEIDIRLPIEKRQFTR